MYACTLLIQYITEISDKLNVAIHMYVGRSFVRPYKYLSFPCHYDVIWLQHTMSYLPFDYDQHIFPP